MRVCVCACGEQLLNALSSICCWPGVLFPRRAGRDDGSGNGNAACLPSSWQAQCRRPIARRRCTGEFDTHLLIGYSFFFFPVNASTLVRFVTQLCCVNCSTVSVTGMADCGK